MKTFLLKDGIMVALAACVMGLFAKVTENIADRDVFGYLCLTFLSVTVLHTVNRIINRTSMRQDYTILVLFMLMFFCGAKYANWS